MNKRNKNELTRTFICIDFSDEVIKEIARVQGVLENVKFIGKMTELENLHLTLKFLGEISEEKIEKVEEKLQEIKFDEMKLTLGEVGTFSINKKPRIVWVKVLGEKIWDLQKKIDDKLVEAGFSKEERFMSHLTIARIKYVKDKERFVEHVSKLGVAGIEFKVDKFKLMKSELRPTGPAYTLLNEYPMTT